MLVDSHCHLDMLSLDETPIDSILEHAADSGVEHMLCVSVSLERWPAMMELIAPYAQISASVGVHPDGTEGEDPDESRLVELAANQRIVAIGETGLDYYRTQGDCQWQRDRFRRHIRAARQVSKPLIVHTREAREDTIRILTEEHASDCGGVLHCFTESWEMARAALDIGFYISFSGIVTFRNATELKEVARKVPLDRILVETDSPFLAPVPRRGKPNQPAYVRHVAEYIAELRGMDFEQFASFTTRNYYQLFGKRQISKN